MMTASSRLAVVATVSTVLVLGFGALIWRAHHARKSPPTPPAPQASAAPIATARNNPQDDGPTLLYAHNILLRKGPDFRIYIRWIRGEMIPVLPQTHPSFDDPESFLLDIQKGVVHANIGDIARYLNAVSRKDAPLKNISLSSSGNQITLHGTLHKGVPLPVSVTGTLSSTSDGHIRFHTSKVSVLKLPLKGLLSGLHITIADLIDSPHIPGTEISGDDMIFDTTKLLPPPHIRGKLTSVRIAFPDIEVIYGNSPNDEAKLAQWHNFLRLTGGTVGFGKLTMRRADLTMIDASKDAWFYLDLVNYQSQLVHGTCRVTPQAGLEIFMPSLDKQKSLDPRLTLEWLKDRDLSVPAQIPVKK